MRKDSKKRKTVKVAYIDGYHGGNFSNEHYAFEGFKSNKLFTSDRHIELDSNFQRPDGIPLDGWGLEIEQECWGIRNKRILAEIEEKVIFSHFPADLFKMQDDGSLGGVDRIGVECITQVMKKSFIRNHYRDFQLMFYIWEQLNISASRSGHCGMHINISNALFGKTVEKQKDNIRKFFYFINKNYSLACKLFKRDECNTHYCGRMYIPENVRTMSIAGGGDHTKCFNFTHFNMGRIELRLAGGQKDYFSFRNTMEVAFFLVERMNQLKWEQLDNIATVFKGCNQYVYKRLEDCELDTATMHEIKENLNPVDFDLKA